MGMFEQAEVLKLTEPVVGQVSRCLLPPCCMEEHSLAMLWSELCLVPLSGRREEFDVNAETFILLWDSWYRRETLFPGA